MALGCYKMFGPCPSTAVRQVTRVTYEYTSQRCYKINDCSSTLAGQDSLVHPTPSFGTFKTPPPMNASIGMHCQALSVVIAHTSLCAGRQEGLTHLLSRVHADVRVLTCRCTGTTSVASCLALGDACETLSASCACSAVRGGQSYPMKRWSCRTALRVLMGAQRTRCCSCVMLRADVRRQTYSMLSVWEGTACKAACRRVVVSRRCCLSACTHLLGFLQLLPTYLSHFTLPL